MIGSRGLQRQQVAEQTEALEAALWTAVRTQQFASAQGNTVAARFDEQPTQTTRDVELIVERVLQASSDGGGSALCE